MADPLPDPTPSEARALILGTGTFWACWAVAVATLFVNGWIIGVVPFFIGFAAAIWLYFGGVFSVAARTTVDGLDEREVRRTAWQAFGARSGWSWMRALFPSYFRRAARTLGWSERAVLGVLGTLLATDLVVFVWMMTYSASSSA